MIRSFFSLLILFLFFYIIASDKPPEEIKAIISNDISSQVIADAKLLAYENLSQHEKDSIGKFCCSYYTESWSSEHSFQFDPAQGYYVRAIVNINQLARLTHANSCGFSYHSGRCSEDKLQDKINETLNDAMLHMLYGKYKSRWAFLKEGRHIPDTMKFNGFNIVNIKRDLEQGYDEVLLGPIPANPDQMIIELAFPKAEGYPDLVNPKQVIS